MTQVASLLTPGAERLSQNLAASGSSSEQAPLRPESTQPEPPSRSLAATPCPSIQVFDSILFDDVDYSLQDNLSETNGGMDEEYAGLSRMLHVLLPSQQDANSIISAGYTAAFLQFFTLPYQDLFRGKNRSVSALSSLPRSSSHPVLLARTLLYLANGLQNLPASTPIANQLDLGCCAEDAVQKYLSGVSCVTGNDEFTPEESPYDHLERSHSQIMRHITVRNESIQLGDFGVTQQVDQMLQVAAQWMPADWWLVSSTRLRQHTSKQSDKGKLKVILQILLQITHFNLLILLHLPYMLQSNCGANYEYSRAACSNASRELPSRYIKFRCTNHIAFCCRAIDFSAFTACLSLLIAHIERWNRGSDVVDFLVHQRASDRALVQEAIELMLEVDSSSSDSLLNQTAAMLEALSDIEADAASRMGRSPGNASAKSGVACGSRCLQLKVPALGTIKMTRNGISMISGQYCEMNKYVEPGSAISEATGGPDQSQEEQLQLQEHENLLEEGPHHIGHHKNRLTFDVAADETDWNWQGVGGMFLELNSGGLKSSTVEPQANCVGNEFFFSMYSPRAQIQLFVGFAVDRSMKLADKIDIPAQ
ncbi:hypothetical protein BDP81DRAFT_474512 [Colletotrichum phormii]|uniref:Transcription factor domain-containing protein n=1 Tax=Colletotrichum phormii TaxID=359342 RepID=A0AAJ0ECY5_9PEZI|nr:uncharacterized protein BDP81DRAFT_474512 [Colletotrichum phormii]KAK1625143.1 hypothetical protein BDP81DRAFT_474512 [Colletotrichum phormii]